MGKDMVYSHCVIGMLITGITLGPYVLDLLDPSILPISSDLRHIFYIKFFFTY